MPRTTEEIGLGLAIRHYRHKREMTQEELGRLADLHPTWISKIESGADASWGNVRRIREALGIPLAEFGQKVEELRPKED